MPTTPISKIKLPDGNTYDFSTTHLIYLPDNSVYNVNWEIGDFTGSTSLISGSDYLLTVPRNVIAFQSMADELSYTSQTSNGTTLSWDSTNGYYSINKAPSATTTFIIYENRTGFPKRLRPGGAIIAGSRSGASAFSMYGHYTTDGSSFASMGSSNSTSSIGYFTVPANAVGIRITLRVTTSATSSTHAYPVVYVQNSY